MNGGRFKMLGIVRQIDAVGRVCLPKEYLRQLNINSRDNVEIKVIVEENGEKQIVIKKFD